MDVETWYRGTDVAKLLGYKDPKQAIRVHLVMANRRQLTELMADEKLGYNEGCRMLN